jgi:predicted Zn-dependent peptidase
MINSFTFFDRKFAATAALLVFLAACSDQQAPQSTNVAAPDETSSSGYRQINTPSADDPLDAAIYELDNGLRVYLTENHEEPRFYAEIAVRAGSKHDPADGTGLAHYLEHLLFKGNQQMGTLDYAAEKPHLDRIVELYEQHFSETDEAVRADIYAQINREAQLAAQYSIPNELTQVFNAMGGTDLNAHTSNEETVYKIGLPANRLTQWAELESNRFVDPVFRLFHTELEIVYEEKNRTLDNGARIINTAVLDLMFKQHPYGQQPTIGTVDHLKNPSLVYIQDYFDTYYVPNNMAIFISGDINPEETIELIADKFSHWESKPLPEIGPWQEAPLVGAERRAVKYPGEEQVQISFRTAANSNADREALVLVDMILDNATAGLINLNLNQQQLVASAGSYPMFLNDAGTQTLWGSPKQDQTLEEVEQLLLAQLEIVKAGDFEEWIIPAIVNDFKKNETAALEFNTARVAMMRQSFINGEEWEHAYSEFDRMEILTKQDVVAVANKYFSDDYVAVNRIDEQAELPVVAKPKIDPIPIDPARQSEFAMAVLAMTYDQIEPTFVDPEKDYRVIEFAEGVSLYYAPNPLNDLFTFSVGIEVGTESNEKLSLAAALMDVAGTQSMDNETLQKQWYRMGTQFNFGAGENSAGFSLSGLDDEFENSVDLMMDVIQTPATDEQTLETLKGILIKSREDRKNSPPAIAQALTLYNRYGEESPLLEAMTNQEIQATTLDELITLPAQLLEYKHIIAYTGSKPLEEVISVLREHYVLNDELKDTPPYRFRTAREVSETEILVVDQKAAQAQVRIEFPDGEFSEQDSAIASAYNTYFGNGMSSIVFQELREARALAYSAYAAYSQGGRANAQNLMIGAIGSQTDKTVDALTAFLDLMENMPQSEPRFEESINSLVNRYRTSKLNFREVIGAVRGWEQLELEGDPRKQRYEALQSATLADMIQFQEQHVKDRPKIISIVGDLSIIDIAELEQFGTVKQVQVSDLFVD